MLGQLRADSGQVGYHLIERGMTNAEIGAELFITPKAVECHLGNIYAKFGLKGRQQLRRLLSDPGLEQGPW